MMLRGGLSPSLDRTMATLPGRIGRSERLMVEWVDPPAMLCEP
jgi:hypothetical protein